MSSTRNGIPGVNFNKIKKYKHIENSTRKKKCTRTIFNYLMLHYETSENFINALKDAEIKEAEPLYTTEER